MEQLPNSITLVLGATDRLFVLCPWAANIYFKTLYPYALIMTAFLFIVLKLTILSGSTGWRLCRTVPAFYRRTDWYLLGVRSAGAKSCRPAHEHYMEPLFVMCIV